MNMACLYVMEYGAKINLGQGTVDVIGKDESKRMLPIETLESIVIFGNIIMSNACMRECLRRGIQVSFLSKRGRYFGRLVSTSHGNPERLKNQIYLSDNLEFTLEFTKKILKSKIHNQKIVLKRYNRRVNKNLSEELRQLDISERKIMAADSIESAMGYEGNAARYYFQALSKLIKTEFQFSGRNRRPPKDAFNAMISLGYTIVFYEIFAELENRNINPYIGFMHKLKDNHPALVSDLLEEWRAVLVDATVLSLIQGNEIGIEEFQKNEENGGIIINNSGVKKLVYKLEKKMQSNMNYLSYLEHPVSFRRAIWWQVMNLSRCIDNQSLEYYEPIRLR